MPTKKEKEVRFHIGNLELRDDKKEGSAGTIGGYAAVFNKLSEPLGRFREKIAPGAFADSLKNDVRAFWNHNMDFILGRTSAKTLSLKEDQLGLAFNLDLPDTQMGNDILTSVRRGDISGMSFGFMVNEDNWERGKAGEPHIRTLLKVDLFEVSPVVFPAYPQTSVNARSAEAVLAELEAQWDAEDKKSANLISVNDARRKLLVTEFEFKTSVP